MNYFLPKVNSINNDGVLMRIASASQYTIQLGFEPDQFEQFLKSDKFKADSIHKGVAK